MEDDLRRKNTEKDPVNYSPFENQTETSESLKGYYPNYKYYSFLSKSEINEFYGSLCLLIEIKFSIMLKKVRK